jgi:DNA-binding Lrp family transcriptional regulator
MERNRTLDAIDRNILNILSLYEHLNLLKLWFEMGEADNQESTSKGKVLNRLQSLMAKGFVERINLEDGNIRWALKEVK